MLRSIRLSQSSHILYLNLAYGMVKTTIKYVHDHDGSGAPAIEANVTVPTTPKALLAVVEQALLKNPSIRLATFSHITSIPAIILPIKELVALCHRRNVKVMIDGAHAMGQIPINVQDYDADFYVANGHKWLFSPKGSAILWANPSSQSLVHPNIISYEGQGKTPFQQQFSCNGLTKPTG